MKQELHVKGMHCPSCEVIIERKLKKVEGVKKVKVNRAKKKVDIECTCDIPLKTLQKKLPSEYTLSHLHEKKHHEKENYQDKIVEIGVSLVFLYAAYLLLNQFNLLPSSFGVTEGMGYGLIFVMGVIASMSTCLAVSGGLLLAVASKYNEEHSELSGVQRFKPHIYFNIGRVIAYTLLGGMVGLVGSLFTLSLVGNGILTIVASVLMIIIGLQMLHIIPFLNNIHIKPPKWIAHKIHDASEHEKATYSNGGAFLFGALTFFLPCGFTQALQLYVLAQGDFMTGALVMFAFSLGTLPMLAGIGVITSFAKGTFQKQVMTFSAVLVIVLGLFSIQYGFALTGIDLFNTGASSGQTEEGFVEIIDGVQVANMVVDGLDYYPHTFKVKKDVPVKWVIDGTKAQGCAQVINIPGIDVVKYLSLDGPTIIEFTPDEEEIISFSCNMGMTTKGAGFEVVG